MNNSRIDVVSGCSPHQSEPKTDKKCTEFDNIIVLESQIMQLPNNPNLITDPILLDPNMPIFGGFVKGNVILARSDKLEVNPQVEQIRKKSNCSKGFKVPIRREVSQFLNRSLEVDAKRIFKKLGIPITKNFIYEDHRDYKNGNFRGNLTNRQYRLARAFAVVIWAEISGQVNHFDTNMVYIIDES
ncbi:MAG TPA: hypothetical protein EYM93_01335 [Methylococcales bacterium]|nr:hypothetical protein [Methylococcales bacterium]